jgi:putative transposase
MRGPKPQALTLSQQEQKELEALVRRHSTPQQVAQRARMILAAAEGKNNSQIARALGVSVDTVRSWRMRWLALQAVSLEDLAASERLTDVQRPGRHSEASFPRFRRAVPLGC